MPDPRAIRAFVMEHMVVEGTCYFHCKEPTSFRELDIPGRVVGLYHCPVGYVSRIVYYDVDPDFRWFLSWVGGLAPGLGVDERDVRVATRHPWEFGIQEEPQGGLEPHILRQVYWTQPRPSDPAAKGLYVCAGQETEGCGSLFMEAHKNAGPLCPRCRAKRE